MSVKPAIVVPAFERPASLQRLLFSLAAATYPDANVPLVISLENGAPPSVVQVAEDFTWKHGVKRILRQEQRLGLKAHILACGDLSREFGAVIVLEDDLMVSPYFYSYAADAMRFCGDDPSVAGISLYHYPVAESCFFPFVPYDDGGDVYYLQHPCSWGQLWTHKQWQAFRDWYAAHPEVPDEEWIPRHVREWPSQSWKKHFAHYLISEDRWFLYPRFSFSTNFEETGTHARTKNLFQSPLTGGGRVMRFVRREDTVAVYDAWFEMKPEKLVLLARHLEGISFSVDLYGQKEKGALQTEFVLTTRDAVGPGMTWALEMIPDAENVIHNISGDGIRLVKTEMRSDKQPDAAMYFYRYRELAAALHEQLYWHLREEVKAEVRPEVFWEVRKEMLDFQRQLPVLTVVVWLEGDDFTSWERTRKNLLSMHYPFLQVIVLFGGMHPEKQDGLSAVFPVLFIRMQPEENLWHRLREEVKGDWMTIIRAGTVYASHSLSEVGKILNRYPHVEVLVTDVASAKGKCILPAAHPSAHLRWDAGKLYDVLSRTGALPVPGTLFWKPSQWRVPPQQAVSGLDMYLQAWAEAAIRRTRFQPALVGTVVESSSTPVRTSTPAPMGDVKLSPADRIMRRFMTDDIAYLRSLYPLRKQLPGVLRHDAENDDWYFSPY